MKQTVTIYLQKFPEDVAFTELIDTLRPFGRLDDARLSNPEKPEHKNGGWAWVKMAEDDAQRLEAATIVIRDRIIRVRRAKSSRRTEDPW